MASLCMFVPVSLLLLSAAQVTKHSYATPWIHIRVLLQDFKIQNVVGSADVKFPVRLEGLAFAHSLFCSVRPSGV